MIRVIKKPDLRIGNALLLSSIAVVIISFLLITSPSITGAGFSIMPIEVNESVENISPVNETPELGIPEPVNETEEPEITLPEPVIEEPAKNETAGEIEDEANKSEETPISISREQLIQGTAEIGRPVKWTKKISLEEPTSGVVVKLPKSASEISVKKQDDMTIQSVRIREHSPITGSAVRESSDNWLIRFWEWFKNLFRITGAAVSEPEEFTEIIIEEEVQEIEIEYETPAPQVREEETESGKQIIVYSDVHYENILTYTSIKDSPENRIKVYWLVNDSREPFKDINYIDTNNNSLIDKLQWVTPYLSEQTFDIVIEITKAEHLDENYGFISDIYDEVYLQDDNWSEAINNSHFVRATYEKNLTNGNVIDVYVRNNNSDNTYFEVYHKNTTSPVLGTSGIISSTTGEWKYITLSNVQEPSDEFDFKIFGETASSFLEFDYIHDALGLSGTGLFVYADTATAGRPYQSNWTGTALDPQEALATDYGINGLAWMRFAFVPQREEALLVASELTELDINFEVFRWDTNTWDNWTELETALTAATTQNFDVACEDVEGGDCLVVYDEAGTDNQLVAYRIWDESGLSGENTLTIGPVNGLASWIEMYPKDDSDDIILAVLDDNLDLSVVLWNGTDFGTPVVITQISPLLLRKSFSFAWEGTSGDGLLAYGTTANGISGYNYTASTDTWTDIGSLFTLGEVKPTLMIEACGSSPLNDGLGHDYIGIILHGSGDAVEAVIWNGTAIQTDPAYPDKDVAIEGDFPVIHIDCEWEATSKNQAVFVWTDNAALEPEAVTYTKDVGWSVADLDTGDAVGTSWQNDVESLILRPDPNSDQIMLTGIDLVEDAECTLWNGTSWDATGCGLIDDTVGTDGTAQMVIDYVWYALESYEIIPPTIDVTYPANNSVLSDTSGINITGTASDANPDSISTNNTNFSTNTGNYTNWNFTNTSPLPDMNYTINITANDAAGNQNSTYISFTKDTLGKVIMNLTWPNATYQTGVPGEYLSANQNTTFFINVSINCNINCGEVRAWSRYNSSDEAYAPISYTAGDTPFYIVNTSVSGPNGIQRDTGSGNNWCYQETANITPTCFPDPIILSNYTCAGNWQAAQPCEYIFDGDWDTYGAAAIGTADLYINYTKPATVINASKWRVRDWSHMQNGSFENLTYPKECWDAYPDKLAFRVWSSVISATVVWECYDGTTPWYQLLSSNPGTAVYEEAMWWNFSILNEQSCGNMNENEQCNVSWIVNATDDGLLEWIVDVNATGTTASNNNSADAYVNIIGADSTPPTIDITYPTNNSAITSTIGINITGTASDTNPDSIFTNNTNFSANSGTYSSWNLTNTSPLPDMNYMINITANDTAGNQNSTYLNFTFSSASSCGHLNSDLNLANNVSSDGTCFIIDASDIVLDLNGYAIEGTGSGYAINNTGFSNITIKNGIIKNYSIGIYFYGGYNSTINSSNISDVDYAIYFNSSQDNNVSEIEISTSDNYEIHSKGGSSNTLKNQKMRVVNNSDEMYFGEVNYTLTDSTYDNTFLNTKVSSVNSSAESVLNKTANITLSIGSCDSYLIYYKDDFYTKKNDVISGGSVCSDCYNINCTGGVLNFTVDHFSSYAIESGVDPDATGFTTQRKVVRNSTLGIHTVYTNDTYAFHKSSDNNGVSWSSRHTVGVCGHPSLVINSSDHLIAVCESTDGAFTSTDNGKNWTQKSTDAMGTAPSLFINNSDGMYVSYSSGDFNTQINYTESADSGSTWSPPVNVSTLDSDSSPIIAWNGSHTLIVWHRMIGIDRDAYYSVCSAGCDKSANWGDEAVAYDTTTMLTVGSMLATDDGIFHLTIANTTSTTQNIAHGKFDGGSWGSLVDVNKDAINENVNPTLTTNGTTLVVIWTKQTTNYSLYTSNSTDSGATWTTPRNLTSTTRDDDYANAVYNYSGKGYIDYVWTLTNSTIYQIMYDNLQVDGKAPTITLRTPADNTYKSSKTVEFDSIATDDSMLRNCSVYTNETGSWTLNETNSSCSSGSPCNITHTFASDSHHLWNYYCCDNIPNCGFSDTNYTVKVDTTEPTIDVTYPTNNSAVTSTAGINITGTASDDNTDSVFTNNTNFSANSGTYSSWNFTNTSPLPDMNYMINITANDSVGNQNSTYLNFTLSSITKAIAIALSSNLTAGAIWDIASLPSTDANSTGNNDSCASPPCNTEHYILISANGTDVDIYVMANENLTSGSGYIKLPNETYANSTTLRNVSGVTKTSLATSYLSIAKSLADGSTAYLKFFLNVSGSQSPGDYNNSLTIKAVEAGATP